MDITVKTILSLVKSALYKEKTVIPENFDWELARKIIASQEIYELTYYGMVYSDAEIPKWLKTKFLERITILTTLWYKGEEVIAAFDKAGIDYIPLKGIVVKDYYPEPYMRHMGDVDILIHESDYADKIKPIMLGLGYREGVESNHEFQWIKDGYLIELHKKIIPSYNKDFYNVIGDGWGWLKDGNQYAYLVAHFAKHYRDSGIGIGHLVDLEVCRKMSESSGISDLHLTKFHNNLQRTLDCWFRNAEYDEITSFITRKIISGGEYGNRITAMKSSTLKLIYEAGGSVKKARIKHALRALFPTFSVMKKRYKVLKSLPFLLPFFYVWRMICSPFRGNIKKNVAINKSIKNDDYRNELKFVGLDFWF